MGLIFDTGCFILAERAGSEVPVPAGANNEATGISTMTLSELFVGVHLAASAKRQRLRERFIADVLVNFIIFDFTAEIARTHAKVHAQLIRSGKIIGAHDLIIAATAMHLDWAVVTANQREFRRVDGLRVHAI